MKRFVSYFVKIILLSFIILIILDLTYTAVYKTTKNRTNIQTILNTKNDSLDYIFLGSSRVIFHINTDKINQSTGLNGLNLGASGTDLNDALFNLKLLVTRIKIKRIFVQVDFSLKHENQTYYDFNILPYLRNKEIASIVKDNYSNFNLFYYVPFIRYMYYSPKIGIREVIMSIIKDKPDNEKTITGFIPLFKQNFPKKRVIFYNEGITLNSNSLIEEIVSICKKNEIDFVFFTSPYFDLRGNPFTQLQEKIPNYVDYSNLINNKDFFMDYGHLNNKGADVLTDQIIKDFFESKQ